MRRPTVEYLERAESLLDNLDGYSVNVDDLDEATDLVKKALENIRAVGAEMGDTYQKEHEDEPDVV